METIKISKQFSPTPGPRYKKEGPFSGELFREQILADKVKNAIVLNEVLTIDLDGTEGYGTSFLEESFGGLIREEHIDYDNLNKIIRYISIEEPYLIDDIKEYLKDAKEYCSQTV